MTKLDRLVWAAGMTFASYGVRIGIRANTPEALAALALALPPRWTPCAEPEVKLLYSAILPHGPDRPGVKRLNLLYVGAARLVRSPAADDVRRTLESDLALRVAELAPRHVFVHAGVVGWRGRAIVLPGRTHTGKSTLTEALVRAGAVYYSDEYAVFDARGRVHPYPRPLSLRAGDGGSPSRHSAEELGGTTGHRGLPLGLVLATRYGGPTAGRLRAVSAGQGLLDLLANAVPVRRRLRATLRVLQRALAGAAVWRGTRGEADATVRRLLGDCTRWWSEPEPAATEGAASALTHES